MAVGAAGNGVMLADRDVRRLVACRPPVRLNVRCMCGVMLAELFQHASDRTATGRQLLVPCEQCRFLVYKFVFGKRYSKHDLFVLQTVDLDTGRVIPAQAQIFLGADRRLRDGARGGELVDPRALIDAIDTLERQRVLEHPEEG